MLGRIKVWQALTALATVVVPLVIFALELSDRAKEIAIPDLSGSWVLILKVNSAKKESFKGMVLEYSLNVKHDKTGVKGQGEMLTENGKPVPFKSRRPIFVDGTISGDKAVLPFRFEGHERASSGNIVLRLAKDARMFNGIFKWDMSDSAGEATLRKAPPPVQ